MEINIEELKKNHNTSYLASVLERLNREEGEVREMLDSDESLHEMAFAELKNIQEQREVIEKQIQDILDKEKEEDDVIAWVYNHLKEGGKFLIEARSKNNELHGLGEPVLGEPNAYIYNDHYRRFIDLNELQKKLEKAGFELESFVYVRPYKEQFGPQYPARILGYRLNAILGLNLFPEFIAVFKKR